MFNVIELRKVVAALKKTVPLQFNMSYWSLDTSCGTVCCAIGHYCHENPNSNLYLVDFHEVSIPRLKYGYGYQIHNSTTDMLADFFQITPTEIVYLFNSRIYNYDEAKIYNSILAYQDHELCDRQYVINRIERFIVDKILEYHRQLPKVSPQLQLA